jgi:hypothetical protein
VEEKRTTKWLCKCSHMSPMYKNNNEDASGLETVEIKFEGAA